MPYATFNQVRETEARDWAEMLFRMYQRWSEQQGYVMEITSVSAGTEAGISSAEFIILEAAGLWETSIRAWGSSSCPYFAI